MVQQWLSCINAGAGIAGTTCACATYGMDATRGRQLAVTVVGALQLRLVALALLLAALRHRTGMLSIHPKSSPEAITGHMYTIAVTQAPQSIWYICRPKKVTQTMEGPLTDCSWIWAAEFLMI